MAAVPWNEVWFFGVVAFFIAILLLLGFVVSRRDHRRGARQRDADEMWRENVREHKRDTRAMEGGQHINPDFRWTEWSRRNHPDR